MNDGTYTVSFFAGCLFTFLSFWIFDFTPSVRFEYAQRASEVCKDGKWDYINNSVIVCSDGGQYSKKAEEK